MTLKFSTGLINSILSDENALKSLDECHQRHMSGDNTALMSVLIVCARFQAVIPDWAVDELLLLEVRLDNFEINDLNKFFGFKAGHKATIQKRVTKEKNYLKVYMALISHRLLGGYFSNAGDKTDGLRAVADATEVSIRIVQKIYNENKENLLKLTKNSTKKETYGVFRAALPQFELRRHGRSTLKD